MSAGKGGDGCVAFHAEKFNPRAGPSGGNGGPGGCVYIEADAKLAGLGSVKSHVRAAAGQPGSGQWKHGQKGTDVVIRVPLGTVVRQLDDAAAADAEGQHDPDVEDPDDLFPRWSDPTPMQIEAAKQARRDTLFVYHPSQDPTSADARHLDRVEAGLLAERKRLRRHKQDQQQQRQPLSLDLVSQSLGPQLVAKGGLGGTGNAAFASNAVRAPKFATKGTAGDRIRLQLELKSLADVGLVGFPNRGKSSLLRAVSHARAQVAPYAFTTLSPHIGTVIMYDDGSFASSSDEIEDVADFSSRTHPTDRNAVLLHKDADESFRFTLADCPGLLPHAAHNVGLGHAFLRHIERAQLLVYVVDLSLPRPELELDVLRNELEQYQPGLSRRARLVVANKADLCAHPQEALERVKRLEEWMMTAAAQQEEDRVEEPVLVCSAKQRANVHKVLACIRKELERNQPA